MIISLSVVSISDRYLTLLLSGGPEIHYPVRNKSLNPITAPPPTINCIKPGIYVLKKKRAKKNY